MDIEEKLQRVESDLHNGRVKRAIDRLHGFIFTYPNELLFRKKLGDLYFKIHFLENAGRYWYLEDKKTKEMQESCDIYERSVNRDPVKILSDLKFRGDFDKLSSTFAKQKIKELQGKSQKKYSWYPDYKPKSKSKKVINKDWTVYIVIGGFITVIILTIIGVVSIIKWIF